MKEWAVWGGNKPFHFDDPFVHDIKLHIDADAFKLSAAAEVHMVSVITDSLQRLQISDSPQFILDRLLSEGFIQRLASDRADLKSQRKRSAY